ncbi:hypothetical protein GA0111570_11366 [Raineyella antarctica]|uniref:Uncharacterized protein n=1 Tax=Raineyella antarctica TaxID=1577474 RepID=A0A1G6HZ04_9ACTN|nr:hypothetical protein [Raineyella antarctica]SDB99420.1 hypothetical protein GA0111570_11366 [Raineyella antarctica]
MADEEYPFIPVTRSGDEHLGRQDRPEPSPLEIMELIETLRAVVAGRTAAPYVLDDTDPLAREACWLLVAAILGKPVRHPAEVTAQWYVAQREAECGASVRLLGKRLEPAIAWLAPDDEAGLPIRSRFAAWMVRAGGQRTRLGPLRAAEIYRDLVPRMSGHGVSRSRPMEMWRETLDGLSGLHEWSGGVAGPHADIARGSLLAYARLGAEIGRRADAVECLDRLRRDLLLLAEHRDPTQDEVLALVEIDLELAFLDGRP